LFPRSEPHHLARTTALPQGAGHPPGASIALSNGGDTDSPVNKADLGKPTHSQVIYVNIQETEDYGYFGRRNL
jgi:hypothetical protein